jgi:hypothetical protein
MRNETLALVTIPLVVVSALAGFYIGFVASHQTITTTTTVGLNGPCTTSVSPPNGTGMFDVYQMTPGSVGVVCVTYRFNGVGVYSFGSPDFGPWTSSGFCACSCTIQWANGTAATLCAGLRITSSRGLFVHFAGQKVTVEYTIQTGKNATGLFWFFIASCDPIALVVGALPASVPSPILPCYGFVGPNSEAVTGVSNIYVALFPMRL